MTRRRLERGRPCEASKFILLAPSLQGHVGRLCPWTFQLLSQVSVISPSHVASGLLGNNTPCSCTILGPSLPTHTFRISPFDHLHEICWSYPNLECPNLSYPNLRVPDTLSLSQTISYKVTEHLCGAGIIVLGFLNILLGWPTHLLLSPWKDLPWFSSTHLLKIMSSQ